MRHLSQGRGRTTYFVMVASAMGGVQLELSLDGKTVLIVEDDGDMAAALSAVVGDTGATIHTAGDGNLALEVAAEIDPDIVILDAMLPKRSGFLVLEKLKPGKKKGSKPFVIMITGNAGKRHQTWAESLGVDGYLNKPFRMERLLEYLGKAVPAS
jgi:DNA-binding response OmpR family regulator